MVFRGDVSGLFSWRPAGTRADYFRGVSLGRERNYFRSVLLGRESGLSNSIIHSVTFCCE
jgi:hypothetical protein